MTTEKPVFTAEVMDAAATLAQRMAKAAGKVSPVVMVAACDMLIQCSVMVATPDVYIEWSNKLAASKVKGKS